MRHLGGQGRSADASNAVQHQVNSGGHTGTPVDWTIGHKHPVAQHSNSFDFQLNHVAIGEQFSGFQSASATNGPRTENFARMQRLRPADEGNKVVKFNGHGAAVAD